MWKQWQISFSWAPKSLQTVTAATKLKDTCSLEESVQSVMSDSETPWTAAHHSSLSITNSQSLFEPMSIELVMPSNHFILCRPHLLPSVFPSIRVFSSELALHSRPGYWSFSFSISPSSEYSGLISFRLTGLISLCPRFSRVFSSTTVQKHQFFGAQPSVWSNSHICM